MKNIIFLAMSTLPNPIRIGDFTAPDRTVIHDCQSQLEPVVRFIMSQCRGQDVSIMSMTTTDTLSDRIIGDVTVSYDENGVISRSRTAEKPDPENVKQQANSSGKYVTSAQGFFEDRINVSEERKALTSCSFSRQVIALEEPEKAIQESVKKSSP